MTDNQKIAIKQAFLDSFRTLGVVSRAATDAGVSRQTVYAWRKQDQDFHAAFTEAEEDSRDLIRAEVHRRAIEGWKEPVYYQGVECGQITKYSDALLMKMMRARLSEYRETDAAAKGAESAS